MAISVPRTGSLGAQRAVGMPAPFVVRLLDVTGIDADHFAVAVEDRLDAELDVGQPGSLDHVQPHFVLEDLAGPGGLVAPTPDLAVK